MLGDSYALTSEPSAEESEYFQTPTALAAAALSGVIDLHWKRHQKGHFQILEPGCGDTASFLDAARAVQGSVKVGCDIRNIERLAPDFVFYGGLDYLDAEACKARNEVVFQHGRYDLIITTPSFSLATGFVERSIELVHPFRLAWR